MYATALPQQVDVDAALLGDTTAEAAFAQTTSTRRRPGASKSCKSMRITLKQETS